MFASPMANEVAEEAGPWEAMIGSDLRDSIGSLIHPGTRDIQRNIIAQQLRL